MAEIVVGAACTLLAILRARTSRRRHQIYITPAELEAWKTDGFFVRRGFFHPAQLEAVRPKVNATDRGRIMGDKQLAKHVVFGAVQTGEQRNLFICILSLIQALQARIQTK